MIGVLAGFAGLQSRHRYLLVARDQQKRMSEIPLHENCKGKMNYTETWEYVTILRTDQELPWNRKVHKYVHFPFHTGSARNKNSQPLILHEDV